MKPSGIGGQAVIEGVMMRNGGEYAVAVRTPEGQIVVDKQKCSSNKIQNKKFARLPIIRGVINFFDSMILGMKSLMYSASLFAEETEEEKAEHVKAIRESGADIIWVGLGAPKQENWMYEHQGMFPGVMIGVGAGFSYHAGLLKRAPEWMQRMSLEWLYRLMQDPIRLYKRYFRTNLKFLFLEMKDKGEEV